MFMSSSPLSVYQPYMIFLKILGCIYNAAALESNIYFLRNNIAGVCDSHHRNDVQLVLKMHTYLK